MFERFVPREEDDEEYLRGLVAYALYKSKKQEWAADLRQRRGRAPNGDEIAEYTATWTNGQVEATRRQAEEALIEYAQLVVEAARPDILKEALRGGFWKGVGAGVVAAIIYTGILLTIAGGLHAGGIDLLSIYTGTAAQKPATGAGTAATPSR
jgi:hypothetical protein